jgi:xanthine/uracil permease
VKLIELLFGLSLCYACYHMLSEVLTAGLDSDSWFAIPVAIFIGFGGIALTLHALLNFRHNKSE